MALLRGHRISVPAYCYPRYDYLSDRAATLRKVFEKIEGSAKFHRCLSQGEEKRDSIIRNGKTLKSELELYVFYKNEDSDFFKINQFLVKDVDEEDKTEPVDTSWEEFLALPKHTKDVDLSTIVIIVLPGKSSEVLKEVEDSNLFTALPKQHTYFVSKDTKECCKMEDISNLDKWTSNLSHLVQSGLEKTVMDVVKQMEQFLAEFLPIKGAPKQGNILDFLREHLDGWYENEHALLDLSPVAQSQGGKETSKTSEGELTITFRQKMQDFLSRKTKCLVLDCIAQDKGLKPSIMNHYLLNNLDFEKTLKKAITLKSMPSYTDLRMTRKKAFQKYFKDCMSAVSPLINSVESLVTNLMVILERMRRLQFVTHALLRLSPLTCKDFKEPPTLPEELQQDLLKEPFVTGCGTIFGELVIHVKSAISEKQKDEIEELLGPYGNLFPYKAEIFEPVCRQLAGRDNDAFMQGDCIRAEKKVWMSEKEKYDYSSLGCFVDVKTNGSDQKTVHFISCHHCFKDCKEEVSVKRQKHQDMSYEHIGLLKQSHDRADIALVQVMKPTLICKHLKCVEGLRVFSNWQFYQKGAYLGRYIYKVGACSQTTKGWISCDNYQLKSEGRDQLPPNVFLISAESAIDVPENCSLEGACALSVAQRFSEEGDSGSVVCDMNQDTGNGLVLGLLHGALDDKSKPEQSIYSYASKIEPALNILKDQYQPDIESIVPSLDLDQNPVLPGAATK